MSLADFLLLRANFGDSGDPAAAAAVIDPWLSTVPEPSLALPTLALLGLARRRRSRPS